MRDKLTAIFRDAAHIYGAQMVGLLVAFGVSILVARLLGAEGRGAYGWIMALFTIAIPLAQWGTPTLNTRLAARHPELWPTLAGNSLMQAWTLGLIVAVVMAGLALTQPTGQKFPYSLILGMSVLPLMVTSGLLSTLAMGMGNVRLCAHMEILQRLSMAGTVLVMISLLSLDVWHLFAAQYIGLLLAIGLALHTLWPKLGGKPKVDFNLFRQHRALIIGVTGGYVAWALLTKVDVLLLGQFRSLEEVGYYTVALSLLDAMAVLPGAVASVLMPRFAAETDARHRRIMLLGMLGLVMAVFGTVCLAAAWVGPWLIPQLFGTSFQPTVEVFERLLLAYWLMAGYQVAQNAIAGYGRARHQMAAASVGLVVKLVFGLMFIPHGMLAAANASVVGAAAALATALYFALEQKHLPKS